MHARRVGAILLVGKLDRLARDSALLMRVYDGDARIMFGDLPQVDESAAGRLLVQMMANIPEFERQRIGERTREALAALKARGMTVGKPENLTLRLPKLSRQEINRPILAGCESIFITGQALGKLEYGDGSTGCKPESQAGRGSEGGTYPPSHCPARPDARGRKACRGIRTTSSKISWSMLGISAR
jgi:hypothetical protein